MDHGEPPSQHRPGRGRHLRARSLSSRRSRAPWWSDEDWKAAQKVNTEILPNYFKAKVAADEVLTILSQDRVQNEEKDGVPTNERFCGISLRPGTLTEEPAGKVKMGKIGAGGKTSRATVAESVVGVLEAEGVRGWVDVIDGDEGIKEAVAKYVKEGQDAVEGEDLGEMKERGEKL